MTYQAIRGTYEALIINALAPVPVYVQNQFIQDLDEQDEYAFVRVNFGLTSENTVGCAPMEFVRGSLVCEVYTAKGTGPGRGLELITPVVKALTELNRPMRQPGSLVTARVGQIKGPSQTALEGQPLHLTRLSCSVHASYDGP